jgi:hypothetical protein
MMSITFSVDQGSIPLQMKVGQFKERYRAFGQNIVQDILSFSEFLFQKTEESKWIREELTPIYAYVKGVSVPDAHTICFGQKREQWDACINGNKFIEVTQVLPMNAHEERQAIATTGLTLTQMKAHRFDHLQIPNVAINQIKEKQKKNYPLNTTLLLNVLGEYSGEDDAVIEVWIKKIRRQTSRGLFSDIFLVEAARLKLFQIY